MGRVSFLNSPIHKLQSKLSGKFRNAASRKTTICNSTPLRIKINSSVSYRSSPQINKRLVTALYKNKEQKKRVTRGRINRLKTKRRPQIRDEELSSEIRKELESDPEHYKVMRKRWQNSGIPDPTRNLTSLKISGKRLRVGAKKNKKAKIFPCTKFHDEKLKKIQLDLKKELTTLHEQEYKEMSDSVKKYAKDLTRASRGRLTLSNVHSVLPIFERHLNSIQGIFDDYLAQKTRAERIKMEEIEKVKAVRNEIHTFNSFYDRKDQKGPNTMFITKEEYGAIHDADRWFSEMQKFYKP